MILQEKAFRDVATIVAEKCVDSETKRPLTVGMVERAMKDLHYSLKQGKTPKQQALEVIKLLKEKMPIERAGMRIKIICSKEEIEDINAKLGPMLNVEREEESEETKTLFVVIDPSNYRTVDTFINKEKKGKCSLEVLNLTVTKEGETKLMDS